jgi:hypothetical protein
VADSLRLQNNEIVFIVGSFSCSYKLVFKFLEDKPENSREDADSFVVSVTLFYFTA